MCLDDLKTTLKMEFLRARSPQMAQKERLMRLIAHSLIRCTAAQAATEHRVALERISFKGSVDALRHFSHAMARLTPRKSADNCGANCSALWPPTWCRSDRAGANRAPSNARRTNTLG